VLLTPPRVPAPSPVVTGEGPHAEPVTGPSTHRRVGHALVVDLDHAPEPGDQTPWPGVLADHLGRRAATVDVLGTAAAPPHRPDLVVGFTPHLASAEAAARIAHRTRARLVVVVQELHRPADHPSRRAHTDRDADARAVRERSVLRRASVVAITSERFRSAVRALGVPDDRIGMLPDWAHVVPAWLDRLDARRALGWPERGFIAVHTGMGPHHDPETVVAAARLAGDGLRVALVGDGVRSAAVRALAADLPHVLVTGPLDAEQRPLSLVAADALVLSECLAPGELVLPAELGSCLAAARPVVAAACPGGVAEAELARAEGASVVVPAGSPRALADALLALRADPARRVAMGLAGLAHAESHLSLRRALARFDAILDAALDAAPDGRLDDPADHGLDGCAVSCRPVDAAAG